MNKYKYISIFSWKGNLIKEKSKIDIKKLRIITTFVLLAMSLEIRPLAALYPLPLTFFRMIQ